MTITQDELARAVAAEMGGDVATATEKALRGEATQFALQIRLSNRDYAASAAQPSLFE